MSPLARRAVACPGWKWMPGMLAIGRHVPGLRLVEINDGGDALNEPSASGGPLWLPDLADPATLGCLLALVREKHGDPRLVAIYCEAANPGQSEGWAVQCADNRLPIAGGDYATEAEALVAALECAP